MIRRATRGVPARYFADAPILLQGRSTADHRTHNPETAGSTPAPAPSSAAPMIAAGSRGNTSTGGGQGLSAAGANPPIAGNWLVGLMILKGAVRRWLA